MSTEAGNRFLDESRRKESIAGWMSEFLLSVLLAVFSLVPAGLLFFAINSWAPVKIPLWVLFLPGLFGMTLWLERQNDIDHRTASWRAIANVIACLVIAYGVRSFLSTDISDSVLRSGIAARRSNVVPFWATLLTTWTFFTYAEFRWAKAKEEGRIR
ncbi:MAG: hypothetical protein WAM70_01700 [Pyrinomonadaceae bacterium]